MIKRIAYFIISFLIVLSGSVMQCSAESTYKEKLSIWPMNEKMGYWYTQQLSNDGSGAVMNLIDSDQIKYFDIDTTDNILRASMSSFNSRKKGVFCFNFVSSDEIIDLTKDNYFYFDFTAQDLMWTLSITVGLDGAYAWDVTIPLQKMICETVGYANLVDNSQYAVRGIYQGRIDLNKAIQESGKNNFYNIDLQNKKIHIVRGDLSYYQCYQNDSLEIRYLGIGHGERSCVKPTNPIERIRIPYEAKNVRIDGDFVAGDEIVNLLNKNWTWKTDVSNTTTKEIGDDNAYLSADFSDGLKVKATGQSLKDKAYIKGAVVGWPKLVGSPANSVLFYIQDTYLEYDFTAESCWDIIITFNTYSKISLVDILNGIQKDNTLDIPKVTNGVRGYGQPGTYKGILNLKEILFYYVSNCSQSVVADMNSNLSNVTIIYENSNNSKKSYENTFRRLRIVKGYCENNINSIADTSEGDGVYKREGYEAPVYKEAELHMPVIEEEPVTITEIIAYVASGAAFLMIAMVVGLCVIKKRNFKRQYKRGDTQI